MTGAIVARFTSRAVDAVAAYQVAACDVEDVLRALGVQGYGAELLLLEAAAAHRVATGWPDDEPHVGPATVGAARARRSYYVGLICGASYVDVSAAAVAA